MTSNELFDLFDAEGFILWNCQVLEVISFDFLFLSRDEIFEEAKGERYRLDSVEESMFGLGYLPVVVMRI